MKLPGLVFLCLLSSSFLLGCGKSSPASKGSKGGIDIDMTLLSNTMVYSELFNMMVSPEDYIGKSVKMKGTFSAVHDDASGNDYFACVVMDATACCSQGLEFIPVESYRYPEDFPAEGEKICIKGVFDMYEEGDYSYCTLKDASLITD